MDKIEHQWYPEFNRSYKDGNVTDEFKEKIKNYFLEIVPLISGKFFMHDDFGLVDCSLAPLLWRIKHLNIKIPDNKKIIENYAERIFSRVSFQESLTETEQEME